MNKSQSRPNIRRKPALSSIGLAVVATLMSSGAQAADTSFTLGAATEVVNANGHQTLNVLLGNSATVGATLLNGLGSVTGDGPQNFNSVFLMGNTLGASAVGNVAQHLGRPANTSIDLSLISDTAGGNQGLASLLHSTNSGGVSSLVQGNGLSIALTGFESGSAVNKDNTIAASTVVNQGVSSITGAVPVGYTSATTGAVGVSEMFGPPTSTAQGSIVVTTAQQNSAASSSATAADNAVALTLSADTLAGALDAGAAVTGNRITAGIKGNSSASTIDIQAAGGAPAFAGSAVVSNTQIGQTASVVASNDASTVSATVNGTNGVSELGGSLAVSGNSISSAATGNEALGSGTSVGNRILLADGLSFAGSGATTPGALLNGHADGTAITADLVIANTQSNQGTLGVATEVASTTMDATVLVTVDSLVNGAVQLAGNTVTSSATGNAASSALASGTNAASFAGTVALANQQDNTNVAVTTNNIGSTIVATVGEVGDTRPAAGDARDSSVSVTGNRSSASARGNEVGQSLSLEATTLALGTTANLSSLLDLSGAGLLQASGAATVSNRQIANGAPVTAGSGGATIGLRAGSVAGPTLAVDRNAQEAVALANNASNQLTLAGATVGSGAGILNMQRVEPEDINPSSQVNATLDNARVFLEAGRAATGVTGSTLALTNNLQETVGYGNLANNALGVTGTTLAAPATTGPASTVTADTNAYKALTGEAVAGYAVLSDQSVNSDISARANTGDTSAGVTVTGALGSSSVLNKGNALVAEAFGNFGQSGLSLQATSVGTGDFSSVASLTSLQAVDAAITAQAVSGAVALTAVTGSVSGSSVSTSGNQVSAQASGSRVANTLDVQATNVATVATGPVGAEFFGDTVTANAAFSLQNVQTGQGGVTATLRDVDNPSRASDVRSTITGDVTAASVLADGNAARASATSNNAANAVGIEASGNLASSSALQNVQLTSAGVHALVGQPGLAASAGGPFSYAMTGTGLVHDGGAGQFTAGTLNVDTSALTSAERAYLLGNGWTDAGANAVSRSAVNYGATIADYGVLFGGGTLPASGVALPFAGTPHLGGVNLAVGGNVSGAVLSVSGNTTYGLARGNLATNRTEVKGNAITAGSTSPVASTGPSFMGGGETIADHALSNLQSAVGATIDSSVYGSFFIDAQAGAISNSSLSVSGNTQMAEARANTATNSLLLDATSVTAVSALQSVQQGISVVNAASNLNLFAPGAVTDSSVLLSNNSNIALAVMNDATNSLAVKGSQVGTGQPGTISVDGLFGDTLTAEHVLANQQAASSAVSSTAVSTLHNQESPTSSAIGAFRSTLSILDNTTAAEATANQALNTAAVTGTASQSASVALRNLQDSTADVTASATSAARVALAPLASTALNGSSVALDGNSTTAVARGNSASNVLNSLAGANYGPVLGGSVQSGDALTGFAVNANAGIMNSQVNSGAVAASSTGASYQVALNAGGATGSGMAVTGNQVAAQAYGNSVVNQLTLNALNTGTPTAAVGSYQRNSGAITASVTNVSFGAGITGPMAGSTVRVTGNQVTATAVGNSAASSILAATR